MKKNILISTKALEIGTCRTFVSAIENGAECLFIGTVRAHTAGKNVTHLFFECYEPMAIKEMEKIATAALDKFDITSIAIHHRIGNIDTGEIPVIIAIGSAHRNASFEACQYAIDTLKETVPIWKKEFFDDGAVWVSAHP
ncbi:MAG: molybdopterin synthase catalytic subunit [bacterium]